jgi:hypothetical protein
MAVLHASDVGEGVYLALSFSIAKEMRLDLAVPGGQEAQPNPIAGLAQLDLWLTCPPAQFAEPGDEPRDILD